ncbi:MAG TPA: hypothetical protein EYQ81_07600 [Sneathiellales bacterium]|nr:hypothetical protein [Sneathiellales bacterium]
MADKSPPNALKSDNSKEVVDQNARDGRPWVLRAFGAIAVFAAWLFYGGDISTNGMILAGLLIGGGGLLVWFSYKRR